MAASRARWRALPHAHAPGRASPSRRNSSLPRRRSGSISWRSDSTGRLSTLASLTLARCRRKYRGAEDLLPHSHTRLPLSRATHPSIQAVNSLR
eukprot:182080-Alexandrium_andersonii.AAC.1